MGSLVAGAAGYIDGSSIRTAPAITFLWVHTFKIRVYAPAILPMCAVYSEYRLLCLVLPGYGGLMCCLLSFAGDGGDW